MEVVVVATRMDTATPMVEGEEAGTVIATAATTCTVSSSTSWQTPWDP